MRALAQSFDGKEKKTVHKTKICELGKSERTEWETESWELEKKIRLRRRRRRMP